MENTTLSNACPMCAEGSLQPRADRQYSFRYLRRLHTVAGLEHAVCDHCETSSYLPGQLARNKARIEQAQRALAGYIGPQDILALRERYGLSQKLAARIFGGGVRAFSKWERGEVRPAEPTAKLMHLALADPGAMRSLVRLAGLCMVCKKEIDAPAHEWPLNGSDFMSGELYPVCSVICYDRAAKAEIEAAKEYDRYVEEMQKDWHKYQEKIVETERCTTD